MEERVKPMLTLEDYVRFQEEPHSRGLSLHQINQIVLMHGFIKLKTKKAAVAGLTQMDLMRPMRSTLQVRETYPCAGISLHEVRADLASLGWQECPIGSVAASTVGTTATTATDLIRPVTTSSAAGGKKKLKRRIATASISSGADLICPVTASSAAGGKKKRKRRTTALATVLAAVDG